MKVTTLPPPGNGGFALGDPFAARATLLSAHDDARKELHRCQVEGDRNAVLVAEWTATETAADLLAHELHLAAAFTMMFRFAAGHFPASLSELLSEVPAYRPFPVHALPPAVAEFVASVAASVGCDPCFVALPALALVGAAVGGARVARPKRGWNEVPALWAVVVGDSGTAKSPAADPVAAVAHGIEDALGDEFARALAEYRNATEAFENADGSDAPTRPVPPAREYFVIDDVTIERLVENLRTSPRGLLQQSDELVNWFNGFARYKGKAGGSDSAKWLGLFDGRAISYQRKTANPGTPRDVRVKRAIVSVSGGIQPGILADALGNPAYLNSGLAARLVFAWRRSSACGGPTPSRTRTPTGGSARWCSRSGSCRSTPARKCRGWG